VIRIPAGLLADVFEHACEGYPEEVCGVLVGPCDGPSVDEARRCVNTQNARHAEDPTAYPRSAREAYVLSDTDTLFVARSLGTDRPVRVVYHSHVDQGASFSSADRAAAAPDGEPAYPGLEYLVVDARADGVAGARQFAWDERARDFGVVAEFAAPTRADHELDLRGEVCPFTFARTKLVLEEMRPDEVLRVTIDNPESARNVPRSLEAEGHDVISSGEAAPGRWEILVARRH
jgi:TusA-related sulfurtransferase